MNSHSMLRTCDQLYDEFRGAHDEYTTALAASISLVRISDFIIIPGGQGTIRFVVSQRQIQR